MANYINNKDLTAAIVESKKIGKLTPEALAMMIKLVNELSKMFRYKDPSVKEDCKQSALLDVLLYWKGFDPEHPKANAFSYFSRLVKNGIAKGFNKLYPELKKGVKVVPMSEHGGVFNL